MSNIFFRFLNKKYINKINNKNNINRIYNKDFEKFKKLIKKIIDYKINYI
jgi:hypothetical protein